MPKTNEKITAFYCRSAVKDNRTIEKQKKQLTDYANNNDIKKYKFYIDNGFSGVSMERPALKTMLEDIEKGEICAVYITHDSRLSRSYDESAKLQKIFQSKGITVFPLDSGKLWEEGQNEYGCQRGDNR